MQTKQKKAIKKTIKLKKILKMRQNTQETL